MNYKIEEKLYVNVLVNAVKYLWKYECVITDYRSPTKNIKKGATLYGDGRSFHTPQVYLFLEEFRSHCDAKCVLHVDPSFLPLGVSLQTLACYLNGLSMHTF